MKKKFIIPLLILGISIGSCQKPDDGPESGTQTPESGTQTPEQGQSPTYTIDIPTTENTSPVFDTEGGSVVLNFTASAEWTANIINTQADSWIDVSPKSGSTGTAKITITVEPNDTYDERSATVQIKCGSAEKNIVVTQKQKNVLTVTKSNFEVPAEGATIQIEVNSNVSIKVSLQADIDWVRETETKAMSANTYNFTVDANNSYETREATIIFEDEKSDLKEYVKIIQDGGTLTVHVPTKGGLQASLSGIDISAVKSLKITGVLNDVDFLYIRSMENLRYLDISEVEITNLPTRAFWHSKVENIKLPYLLTEIGEQMFYCCALTSIEIPASVEAIEYQAFNGCKLTTITFEKGSKLKSLKESSFESCSLTSIEIPASVETIEHDAFEDCYKLTTVTFEKGSKLKSLKSGSFYCCKSLTSIEIPASVETIENAVFFECTSLASVTFEKGSKLKTLGTGGGIAYWGTFKSCTSLTSIEIPASVETISDAGFYGCTSLSSVTFEKGSKLRKIAGGSYTGLFWDCSSLVSIEIPANVEIIGQNTFNGCTNLVNLTFEKGSNLKSINENMFENITTIDMSECAQVESLYFTCPKLSLFKIGTEIPPTTTNSSFQRINKYSILKVPSSSVDAYKTAEGWKNFGNISALDE